MALKSPLPITWSPKSAKSFDNIVKYLEAKFADREVQKFIRQTVKILEYIAQNPNMFRSSVNSKHKHVVILNKHTTLYYQYKPIKKEVELLLFWDNRQDPKRLKY